MKIVATMGFLAMLSFTARDVLAKGEGGGIAGFCYGQNLLMAYSVRFPEERPEMVVVATNFGVLVSRDGGETYGWICPDLHSAPIAGNFTLFTLPGLATMPDGTLLILTGSFGYWQSSEDGCRIEPTDDADLQGGVVVSVATRPARARTVFVATSWPGRGPFGVFVSESSGADFTPTELISDEAVSYGSVFLTSNAERLYATTRSKGNLAAIWSSDDLGQSWRQGAQSVLAVSSVITGGDPTDADTVYLEAIEQIQFPCDFWATLYRSTDRGDTLEPLFETRELPIGSVLRRDGSLWVATKESGVSAAAPGGQFEPVAAIPAPVACMTSAPDGRIVTCPLDGGAELVSVLDDDTGETSPLLTLDRITGPLDCPAGSEVARTCPERWAQFAAFWGLGPPLPDPDAGPDSGASGRDSGPRSDPDAAAPDAGPEKSPAGCACAAGQTRGADPGALLIAICVAALLRHRLNVG